jgi:hypothetical protein
MIPHTCQVKLLQVILSAHVEMQASGLVRPVTCCWNPTYPKPSSVIRPFEVQPFSCWSEWTDGGGCGWPVTAFRVDLRLVPRRTARRCRLDWREGFAKCPDRAMVISQKQF